MNVLYIREELLTSDQISQKLHQFASDQNLSIDKIFIDHQYDKHWEERKLKSHILNVAQPGDKVIVHDGANLANSLTQILEIFRLAADKSVDILFEKCKLNFFGNAQIDTNLMIRLLQLIESNFVTKRSKIAMAKRKAKGLHVGRPKGRINEKLKLDAHKDEIALYLKHGVSKIVIAARIGCHAQTLYNYLNKNRNYG